MRRKIKAIFYKSLFRLSYIKYYRIFTIDNQVGDIEIMEMIEDICRTKPKSFIKFKAYGLTFAYVDYLYRKENGNRESGIIEQQYYLSRASKDIITLAEHCDDYTRGLAKIIWDNTFMNIVVKE